MGAMKPAGSDEAARFLREIRFPSASKPESFDPLPATQLRIERSRLLAAAGYPEWAAAELRFGARTDAQRSLAAMELAASASSPDESLHRMKSLSPDYLSMPIDKTPRRFWELLFPLPYKNDLVRAAEDRKLDPYLMAGLIRQESEFNPKAISRARALGLTQLRAATGKEMARRAGVSRFQTSMLFRPEISLRLGAYYIRLMLDQWNGQWEQVLASYNAGKSRANEWVKWGEFREPSEFVETIPFTETRDYVQAVLRNAALYRRLYAKMERPAAAPKAPATTGKGKGKGPRR
jgi:soluble lytic murein transglycosylase